MGTHDILPGGAAGGEPGGGSGGGSRGGSRGGSGAELIHFVRYEVLVRLTDGQLVGFLSRNAVPVHEMPPASVTRAERAESISQWIDQRGRVERSRIDERLRALVPAMFE